MVVYPLTLYLPPKMYKKYVESKGSAASIWVLKAIFFFSKKKLMFTCYFTQFIPLGDRFVHGIESELKLKLELELELELEWEREWKFT